MNIWQNILDEITKPLHRADINNATVFFKEYVINAFSRFGINIVPIQWLVVVAYGAFSVLIAFLGLLIARLLIRFVLTPVITRSKNRLDNFLIESKVFRWMARIIPVSILYLMLPAIFNADSTIARLLQNVLSIALLIPVVGMAIAIINTLRLIYEESSFAKDHPIKGYTQIIKVIIITIAILLVVGVVFDVSVFRILGGLGAFSAVLLLIFRDPILALVASTQLTLNNMVRIGDWIAIPGEGADGTVIDMTLQSIRIQNWDKSIISVPLYNLISGSFVNWRGMEDSGGRRIKRSVIIDMSSVTFCTPHMLNEFKKYELLREYIVAKEKEVSESNDERHLSPVDDILSSRAMTNLGTFRAYAYAYLRHHPHINQEMTCMVRQHQPTDHGVPLECYCFSAEQDWIEYESIQADIFDHLMAVVPVFGLHIFQSPSGSDFQGLGGSDKQTQTQ